MRPIAHTISLMTTIHPTASVSQDCTFGRGVEVGPYCVLRGRVTLGNDVKLIGNVYLNGPVSIGDGTVVYPFACLGFEPQDFKFKPGHQSAGVLIGNNCIIRENATVHASTHAETPTIIGDKVFMMVGTHVAHDCRIGNRVVMVNGAGIAGHSIVQDDVNFGGAALVHQFCRIGRMVMMSGGCAVSLDVPPFCMVNERNRLGGLNTVGLRRSGMDRTQITHLRRAFRDLLRRPMPRGAVVQELRLRAADCPPLAEMADFIADSKRGIAPGMGKPPRDSLKRKSADEEADEPTAVL